MGAQDPRPHPHLRRVDLCPLQSTNTLTIKLFFSNHESIRRSCQCGWAFSKDYDRNKGTWRRKKRRAVQDGGAYD